MKGMKGLLDGEGASLGFSSSTRLSHSHSHSWTPVTLSCARNGNGMGKRGVQTEVVASRMKERDAVFLGNVAKAKKTGDRRRVTDDERRRKREGWPSKAQKLQTSV